MPKNLAANSVRLFKEFHNLSPFLLFPIEYTNIQATDGYIYVIVADHLDFDTKRLLVVLDCFFVLAQLLTLSYLPCFSSTQLMLGRQNPSKTVSIFDRETGPKFKKGSYFVKL